MVIGFAHRGARTEHPDNTLPGFARALTLGANGLESDAWVTADGIAVLDHDGVVRRGLRRRSIALLPRADLPGHIPTLRSLYDLAGADQVDVSLDVKDPAAVDAVLEAAAGRRSRLWLCSPTLDLLREWRAADSTVRLVHSTSLRRLVPDPALHPARLAAAGVDALNLRAGEWSAPLVAACHAGGIRAFGWDAQARDTLMSLLRMGLDAVYSDHVEAMVAVLAGSEQLEAAQRPDAQDGTPDDQVPGDGPDVA